MFWRGVVGYLPANIVQGLVGFGALYVFTRLLTPEAYGRYAVAFAVVSMLHTLMFTWIEAAMSRFQVGAKDEGREADHAATLYGLLGAMSLAIVAAAALAAIWLRQTPELAVAVVIGLLAAVARCIMRMVQERSRAEGEVTRFVVLDVLYSVVGLAAGAGLALMGLGGAAPIAGGGIAAILAVLFTWRSERRLRTGGRHDAARAKRYAAYGLPMSMSLILSIALFSIDRLIIAGLLGEAEAGAYHAGYSLANRTLDVLFLWLGTASAPALVAALERGGTEALRQAARTYADLLVGLTLPAAVGIALVARPLADVMVGEALRQDAALVTPGIAAAAMLSGFTTYYFHQAFTLSRRTGLMMAAMALPLVANLGLNVVLIPRFGLQGAVLATVLSFVVGAVAAFTLARRAQPLPFPIATLLRAGLACGVMAVAVQTLPAWGGVAELALKASVGGLVYALAAAALDVGGVRTLMLAQVRLRTAAA